MKKILFTICAGLIAIGGSAQVKPQPSSPQKPATQESIDAGRKAATTGMSGQKDSGVVKVKRDTTGMAARRDSLIQAAKKKEIPASAETSKLLLMQMINSINTSAYKDTTTAAKTALLKSLKGLQDLDFLKVFMTKLQAALAPTSFNKAWSKRESSWNKEMKDLKLPAEFNRLLIDFESQLKPEAFSEKWKSDYKTKWLNEMKRVK